jgi:hypothetical protein
VYKNLQQNRGKSFNQATHRHIQPKINVHDINQLPLINPNQTPTRMPPQTPYSQVLKQNQLPPPILDQTISPILNQLTAFLTEFKIMFDQLINQNGGTEPTEHGYQQNHYQRITHCG